jgi:hypothetical protein
MYLSVQKNEGGETELWILNFCGRMIVELLEAICYKPESHGFEPR